MCDLKLRPGKEICRFSIPYPATKKGMTDWNRRFGLNAYYAGKHWAQRQLDKDAIRFLTRRALQQAKIPWQLVTEPVWVHFSWNDRLDIDNHAALGKMIVDAMKGWILLDDTRRWFQGVSHAFWDRHEIGVAVLRAETEVKK